MNPLCIHIPLDANAYDIHIQAGLLHHCSDILTQHIPSKKTLIISDDTVAAHHAQTLQASLDAAGIEHHLYTFPAGEPSKNMHGLEGIWQACAEHHLDRNSTLIALGGGVVGDMCGFAAATWMRGISFIQIPTSLLAMVDSSVGGKTGVNSSAGKNLIGAFKQPTTVIIDPQLITTMAAREYQAGLGEVCKYGIIDDYNFFVWQEENSNALLRQDPDAVTHAVAESCRSKARYVLADETEKGVRAHLNYGHTFGHAIERETSYTSYLHGEAVAIGMVMAADFSQRIGLLKRDDLIERQRTLLQTFQLPVQHSLSDHTSTIQALAHTLSSHCQLDKKVSNGQMRFVAVQDFADIHIISNPDTQDVLNAFSSALTTATQNDRTP